MESDLSTIISVMNVWKEYVRIIYGSVSTYTPYTIINVMFPQRKAKGKQIEEKGTTMTIF